MGFPHRAHQSVVAGRSKGVAGLGSAARAPVSAPIIVMGLLCTFLRGKVLPIVTGPLCSFLRAKVLPINDVSNRRWLAAPHVPICASLNCTVLYYTVLIGTVLCCAAQILA